MADTQLGVTLGVGDGGGPETFNLLGGLIDIPDLITRNRTTRDASDMAHHASSNMKLYEFNKIEDGQEITITVRHRPADVAQIRLKAVEGVNAGCNFQYTFTSDESSPVTETVEFNALVYNLQYDGYSVQDTETVQTLTFTIKVNGTIPTKTVS